MAKKLERPLVIGGNEAYPLTTADQIIKADGSKLETSDGINADTLGGHEPSYYKEIVETSYNDVDYSTGYTMLSNGLKLIWISQYYENISIEANGGHQFVFDLPIAINHFLAGVAAASGDAGVVAGDPYKISSTTGGIYFHNTYDRDVTYNPAVRAIIIAN